MALRWTATSGKSLNDGDIDIAESNLAVLVVIFVAVALTLEKVGEMDNLVNELCSGIGDNLKYFMRVGDLMNDLLDDLKRDADVNEDWNNVVLNEFDGNDEVK